MPGTKKLVYKKRAYKNKPIKSVINREITKRLNKNLEQKFIDTAANATSFGTTIQCLTSLVIGNNDIGNRVGDQVKSKSISFKGQIVNADTYNVVRVTLIRVNQLINPTSPIAVGDLYQNVSTSTLLLNSAFHMDNMRAGLFTVMYDRKFKVDTDDPIQLLSFYKKLSHRIDFQSNTSVAKGHLFLYMSNDSAASPNPSVDIYTRYVFNDA